MTLSIYTINLVGDLKQELKKTRISVLVYFQLCLCFIFNPTTVVPTESDSDVIFCLQLLSKMLTCTPHLG